MFRYSLNKRKMHIIQRIIIDMYAVLQQVLKMIYLTLN